MIEVVPYNPDWKEQFDQLKNSIWPAVEEFAMSIEHVGSTSVEGLWAKPVIDLDIVISSKEKLPFIISALARLGYAHEGDRGIEDRESFRMKNPRFRHNLYCCLDGCLALKNHLLLRDRLRRNPEACKEYSATKQRLAEEFPRDIEAYVDGKTAFIVGLLEEEGVDPEKLNQIDVVNKKSEYLQTTPMVFDFPALESDRLRLETLTQDHLPELIRLIDPEIWRWYTHPIKEAHDMEAYVETHLLSTQRKASQTYVVRLKSTGELVGSSRFLNIETAHRRLEIGSTWYSPAFQRTFVNSECKKLMLSHAFERLNCICVQFQTDALNEASRRAIMRIGGKPEGIKRGDRLCHDGRVRNSAIFSILHSEWPMVKERLTSRLVY